ncbi:MAG: 3-methylornithine--L-lysine ligase PylC [Deltaproteobacteria bacterium]|nr:3-methylornithine--L-lysine ligase PylC [Deltaproteobacteria bacterium]
MRIAIIGGKLQGLEAAYLAHKAGWETLIIDKNPNAPAMGVCGRFIPFEFSLKDCVPRGCPEVDCILPAIEDTVVLDAVQRWAAMEGIPLAFDIKAHHFTRSKSRSDALFKKMDLSAPRPWPDCGFPVVVKPDEGSGSRGVQVFHDQQNFLSSRFSQPTSAEAVVMQEYIVGSSHSIEVIGVPGNYTSFQVTDLGMDKDHDCKRVIAPTRMAAGLIDRFATMAIAVAEAVELKGIMDVEVLLSKGELHVLEIDARLPSQTPIAVYWSTGINMVEQLANLFLGEKSLPSLIKPRFVLLEHIQVRGTAIDFLGEHIMAGDGPLALKSDFFGADEALTSYTPGKCCWLATMIFSGTSRHEVSRKRKECYDRIIRHMEPSPRWALVWT